MAQHGAWLPTALQRLRSDYPAWPAGDPRAGAMALRLDAELARWPDALRAAARCFGSDPAELGLDGYVEVSDDDPLDAVAPLVRTLHAEVREIVEGAAAGGVWARQLLPVVRRWRVASSTWSAAFARCGDALRALPGLRAVALPALRSHAASERAWWDALASHAPSLEEIETPRLRWSDLVDAGLDTRLVALRVGGLEDTAPPAHIGRFARLRELRIAEPLNLGFLAEGALWDQLEVLGGGLSRAPGILELLDRPAHLRRLEVDHTSPRVAGFSARVLDAPALRDLRALAWRTEREVPVLAEAAWASQLESLSLAFVGEVRAGSSNAAERARALAHAFNARPGGAFAALRELTLGNVAPDETTAAWLTAGAPWPSLERIAWAGRPPGAPLLACLARRAQFPRLQTLVLRGPPRAALAREALPEELSIEWE